MKSFLNTSRSDLLIGLVVIASLAMSSNLVAGFMPSNLVMLAVAVFVAAFSLFCVLIWRESPRDEREAHIMLSSDRLGFLTGAIILSVGLVVQSLRHESTILLATTLSVMILAKLIGKHLNK
jgi:cobalamin synthase